MKILRSLLCSMTILAVAALFTARAAFAATTPAISAFEDAFKNVQDYTVTVTAQERLGSQIQNRTYDYWFKKPNLAKTLIVQGDGSGSGGVWNGGDQVSGHQGGMLSFIHLKVGLHDGRATSLRGYTIPQGLLQNEVEKYTTIPGDLTQKRGPKLNGVATDEIDLQVKDPAQYGGVTRMIIYLDRTTHFPVRQLRFAGDEVVADDTFSDLKTNVGLKDSDFPF